MQMVQFMSHNRCTHERQMQMPPQRWADVLSKIVFRWAFIKDATFIKARICACCFHASWYIHKCTHRISACECICGIARLLFKPLWVHLPHAYECTHGVTTSLLIYSVIDQPFWIGKRFLSRQETATVDKMLSFIIGYAGSHF